MTVQDHSPDSGPPPAPEYVPAEWAGQRPAASLSRVRLPSGDEVNLVVGHDDVYTVLTSPAFSRDLTYDGAPRLVKGSDVNADGEALINMDPPRHTRLRRLVAGAFTPRRLATWRPRTEAMAEQLVDEFTAGPGPRDLVREFSYILPVRVICELLGVPAADMDKFRGWTEAFLSITAYTAEERAAAARAFAAYNTELVAAHRAEPGNSLVDALISARDDGAKLTEEQLVRMITSLIIAGHETTANALSRGLFSLLATGGWHRLTADPGLVPAVVEEILRHEMPGDGGLRVATEDVTLSDGVVRKGEGVLPAIAAANRDPARHPDPDRFVLDRYVEEEGAEPACPHLTFGHGPHYCLGAGLARQELEVALETLLRRLPGMRLAVPADEVRWRTGMIVRGLEELPVTW